MNRMYQGYEIRVSYVWADRLWKARVMEGNIMRAESNQDTAELAVSDAMYLIDRMIDRQQKLGE